MVGVTSLYVFLTSSLLLLTTKIFDRNPSPIFGVYRRRNGVYWFKVIFLFTFLWIRKVKLIIFPPSKKAYYNLEKPQKLASTPKAVDAVYFNSVNKNGDSLIVGTARKTNRLIDGFIYLKISSLNLGLLQSPKLPDTTLFNTGDEESYEAEGIKVTPIEPMKKWRITYEGQLCESNNRDKLHDVKIDALYTSTEPWFTYETGMDPWNMAKVLAYEKWSRSYFKNVNAVHQLHYEQFGIFKVKITIDGKEYNIELDALRDHTVGPHRDWANFRRYAIHWVTAENGDHFSIGSICQPLTYSRMKIGYMYSARHNKMYPLTENQLELYSHGELGTPPKDYAFTFTAGNTNYVMQVNIIDAPYFYISKQWEAKVYECTCKIEVNGVKGHGVVEWQYRNVEGRNVNE